MVGGTGQQVGGAARKDGCTVLYCPFVAASRFAVVSRPTGTLRLDPSDS